MTRALLCAAVLAVAAPFASAATAPTYDIEDFSTAALIDTFKTKLFDAHGESIDTFTIDDGWDNKDSLWEIRKDRFPRGFAPSDRPRI